MKYLKYLLLYKDIYFKILYKNSFYKILYKNIFYKNYEYFFCCNSIKSINSFDL